MARDTWYRLDNIGKFYSSQAGNPVQAVFRYSATLVADVDATVLQHALDRAVEVYPSFNVCLRNGIFWHYLEQAAHPPRVQQESLPICFGLHVDTRSMLFRVSYHRARINLEVSHMVSDGRGTLGFFKTLLYSYLQERHGVEGVGLEHNGSHHEKVEDSFDKYYERQKAVPTKAASVKSPKVYRLRGWHDEADPTFLEYHVPVDAVLDLARSHGVSITALVIAVIMCAIRAEMPRRDRHRAIRVDVPVDLRQHFESATAKNFFGLAFVSYIPGDADEPVEEVARQVHAQLRVVTTAEELKPRMNRMISHTKNPLIRLSPLFAKDFVLECAAYLAGRSTTTTVSNLGQIDIDERLACFIRDINILTSTSGIKYTLCSFGNDLSIGISTVYSNLAIVSGFCRYFSAQGIRGRVNINKDSAEVAEDRREARMETRVRRLGGRGFRPGVTGAHPDGSQTGGPQTGGPQADGPQVGGPQVGSPQADGPQDRQGSGDEGLR
jgi:NRPS condensation-like uncharacterized protein